MQLAVDLVRSAALLMSPNNTKVKYSYTGNQQLLIANMLVILLLITFHC
jgi:hypothetical protein